jgi:hypothetical protein
MIFKIWFSKSLEGVVKESTNDPLQRLCYGKFSVCWSLYTLSFGPVKTENTV